MSNQYYYHWYRIYGVIFYYPFWAPRAEDTSQRGPEFIAYTEHGVPRYLVVSNIATIEHAD
jgi:hypothetical protein